MSSLSPSRTVRAARVYRFHGHVAVSLGHDDGHGGVAYGASLYLSPAYAATVARHLQGAAADCTARPDERRSEWPTVESSADDADTLPCDTRTGGVFYVHRIDSAGVSRAGHVHHAVHVTDRQGAPAVLLLPGHSSYRPEVGRWYHVRFGGRLPRPPYDARVASLEPIDH